MGMAASPNRPAESASMGCHHQPTPPGVAFDRSALVGAMLCVRAALPRSDATAAPGGPESDGPQGANADSHVIYSFLRSCAGNTDRVMSITVRRRRVPWVPSVHGLERRWVDPTRSWVAAL